MASKSPPAPRAYVRPAETTAPDVAASRGARSETKEEADGTSA
eukprot:CAMPEP_0194295678 /NCGR_PEP_ID=MMETSP0169-20130528/54040_1 /TAXON_ID=218684 /ORGANISM="Corethron pennatum, Strain L29A3" /LENGTH=42 /DNA_ID= /DNA_START= /DNA_END= /DNA_ORIENTATION=